MVATSMPTHRNNIGGPGVGKGTQCTWLTKDPELVHVSVGDLLRAKAKQDPMGDGIDIEARMREGLLSPVEVVQSTLRSFLVKEMREGKSIFLVDGFPRSLEQARHFEAQVRNVLWRRSYTRLIVIKGVEIKAALYFYAPEAVMHERMMERSKTSGRVDDTPETFQKRYKGFEEENADVLDYFQERGKLHKVRQLSKTGHIVP